MPARTERPGAPAPERESDLLLRDGRTLHVRPVVADDRDALLAFLEGLSPESRRLRFFSGAPNLRKLADSAVDVDYRDRYSLVGVSGPDGAVVAHAGYVRIDPGWAELFFAVADELQGQGVATLLLAHLAEAAEQNGIASFEAEVLPDNPRMVEVFRDSGFAPRTRSGAGTIVVEMPTSLSADARERFEERERLAEAASIRRFLAPGSVAVVGASRRRGTVGGEIFHNLLASGFNGTVYPVNPRAEAVQGVRAYTSLSDIPGPVELAVVAVDAGDVNGVAEEAARLAVRGLVVVSAGFAEAGQEGKERQRALLATCRSAGMRLIGPNCLGILNTHAGVRLNASFSPAPPPPGRVGFMSQSGALGLAVIDRARALGIGLSSFVSAGNKADVSANDLLQYWEGDEATDVVLLYLESFGNPRRFARVARRLAHSKPVVAVKSGRSQAGAQAAGSHTGALLQASDATVDALFQQAGVIRTDTLAEMFDVTRLLAAQPPPAGRRAAIVTNAGGPGILCADACAARGLDVVPLPDDLRERLARLLPPAASTANPVDMIATATPGQYAATLRAVVDADVVDALIVIFIPPLLTAPEEVARALRDAVAEPGPRIPVLAVFMSEGGPPAPLQDGEASIPSFDFPEEAAAALAHAARHGEWRRRDSEEPPALADIGSDEAAAVLAEALAVEPGWLAPGQVDRLLRAYGIPLAESRLARTPHAAGAAAAALGGQVAVKAVAPELLHKTEAGAVRLGVHGERGAERAARETRDAVRAAGFEPDGFLVQRMAPAGVEMIAGVVQDDTFGPVVASGAGGVNAELLDDVAVRITPLTERDAAEMVRSLQAYPLLDGFRGAPTCDVPAFEDVLLRLATMADAHPEIAELDCNPVIVSPEGALVVDARIRVQEPPPRRPWPALD